MDCTPRSSVSLNWFCSCSDVDDVDEVDEHEDSWAGAPLFGWMPFGQNRPSSAALGGAPYPVLCFSYFSCNTPRPKFDKVRIKCIQ